MRRRLAALLVACLAVPALALAADTDPKKQLNAADQRKAASIVLKRADFGAGWKKTPSTPGAGDDLSCPGYDPDESDLVLTGEAEAEFERTGGFPAVMSFASVYKTKANALASWARSVKPALARCAAQLFKDGIESTGAQATVVKQGRIAFPKLAPRTAAFRVALKVTVTQAGETTTVPLTVHLVAVGHGRGDAGLATIAFGDGLTAPELRSLGKLLAKRLAAAKL